MRLQQCKCLHVLCLCLISRERTCGVIGSFARSVDAFRSSSSKKSIAIDDLYSLRIS